MKMKSKWFSLFLSLLSLNTFATETSKVKLYLNWKAEPEFGGFYEADLGKHFEKNNIQAEIIEGGSGTPISQMVAAGKADFGISSADEVILTKARGGDIISLFAVYKKNPQGVMTHEELGFKSMKDVFAHEGNLAIAAGMPYTLFLQNKFAKETKVKMVPYLGGVGPFLADKNLKQPFSQQCFATSEPLTAQRSGAKVKTFLIADEGFDPYTAVLITRQSFLKQHPELVKKMVMSVREGWKNYLKDPTLSNEKMSKLNTSIDLKTFKEIADAQKPFIVFKGDKDSDLGKMETKRWESTVETLFSLKLIQKKPELKDLFINF